MSERQIDAERAGGTGNAAPPAEADPLPGAAPVAVEDARAAVAGWLESGMPLFGLHQIAVVLDSEVKRLQDLFRMDGEQNAAHIKALHEQYAVRLDVYGRELARLCAALPDIIACPYGDGTTCTRDNYGWSPCCSARLRMVKAGLISAPVREVESGDGA